MFLEIIFGINSKLIVQNTVIIAKVRELRENSILILHYALFEGVSI